MEATEILTQAKAEEGAPGDWIILPLQRRKVVLGIVGWIFGIILGAGLLALLGPIIIPYNYLQGAFQAVLSTILLGVLFFIALGSAWALYIDVRRLRQRDQHVIVITTEDFVKQEGQKILHVPLANVRYVTARGRPKPDRTAPKENPLGHMTVGENVTGFIFGRAFTPSGMKQKRKNMRTPASLAFIDTRNDREVVVVSDTAYGDPFMIAAFLKKYAANVQNIA
ncbi:MAG: hypothetical protein M3Y81_29545 [Chloroflexota bacterium]|nr:hypothetical protein [Chloroflexota bacterium]